MRREGVDPFAFFLADDFDAAVGVGRHDSAVVPAGDQPVSVLRSDQDSGVRMEGNPSSLDAVTELQRSVGEREDRRAAEERRESDGLSKPHRFDLVGERR